MSTRQGRLPLLAVMVIALYIVQGLMQGLCSSIPIYLASYKASWKQQGTFSWVSYPLSFKILWAPLIDAVYSHRLGGRPQTWLPLVQLAMGAIMIVTSFYLRWLLVNLHVASLTVIFFFMYFLISAHDIVVDGWSVTLFTVFNPQWSSTCQIIGEMLGQFFGSTVLMTLESANFTNRYIRTPLSLPHQSRGLFSLQQFTLACGVITMVVGSVTTTVVIYQKLVNRSTSLPKKVPLCQAYFAVLKLLKKRCVRELLLVLLTFNIGFAATYGMTTLVLIRYGVTRDILALINIPLLFIHMTVPLCLSSTRRPLVWFARGYIPRLFASLILAIYIFFTPSIFHQRFFYSVLIGLLCLNEACVYILKGSRVGFYARISDPRLTGTYMTLLGTMVNLGQNVSTTVVLYIADRLPKAHAYSIQVVVCFVLGCVWIALLWRLLKRLDQLPVEEWHLKELASSSVATLTAED